MTPDDPHSGPASAIWTMSAPLGALEQKRPLLGPLIEEWQKEVLTNPNYFKEFFLQRWPSDSSETMATTATPGKGRRSRSY